MDILGFTVLFTLNLGVISLIIKMRGSLLNPTEAPSVELMGSVYPDNCFPTVAICL